MLLHCRQPFASCMDTENLCAAESITVWQLCLLAGGGYSFSVYFSMSPVDFNSSVCFHTSFYHLCEKWRYVFSGCITNLEQKFLAKQSLQRYISINCIYYYFFLMEPAWHGPAFVGFSFDLWMFWCNSLQSIFYILTLHPQCSIWSL